MRINIAFFIDTISCDTAGTQRQLLGIVKRLDQERFAPQIVCLHSSPWMETNELPCPVTVLGYNGFLDLGFPAVVRKLRCLIQESQIHILQTFFEDSVFVAYLATLRFGRPPCVLLSSRRDMGLGKSKPWYHSLFSLALPWVNRRYDGIVCNGEEIRRWASARERVPEEKFQVVPNGTELPGPRGETPEILRQNPAPLWVGLVASLTPVKRIDLFVQALGEVHRRSPELEFHALVLGEGPERERLLSLAEDVGIKERLFFPGAVTNVSAYLHYMDVGVLCSDREGFSNSVIEYLAHTLPVVVSDVGGNRELVDATSGIKIPKGDASALAEGIFTLLHNRSLREEMGKAGREKVEKEFLWERSMNVLETYFESLLDRIDVKRYSRGGENVA